MNVDLGTILEEELDILNAAVNLCEPTEVDGQGVLVTCVNGVRTWQVTSKDFGITIRGDKHQFDGNFVIPGRLINGAASFGVRTTSSRAHQHRIRKSEFQSFLAIHRMSRHITFPQCKNSKERIFLCQSLGV